MLYKLPYFLIYLFVDSRWHTTGPFGRVRTLGLCQLSEWFWFFHKIIINLLLFITYIIKFLTYIYIKDMEAGKKYS